MSMEEIRATLAAYRGELPTVSESEQYEDSEQFVGKIAGERVESVNPVAEKFFEAAGMLAAPGECCGNCCDSNCSCF